MGFNPSTMKFAKALHVLQAMSKSTWERKVNVYQKWGLSGDQICLAFRRNTWCMAVSEDKIMRVMEFLVNKMGMESFHHKQIPQYLFDIVCKSDWFLGFWFFKLDFQKVWWRRMLKCIYCLSVLKKHFCRSLLLCLIRGKLLSCWSYTRKN